jgi:hypothetical protein
MKYQTESGVMGFSSPRLTIALLIESIQDIQFCPQAMLGWFSLEP